MSEKSYVADATLVFIDGAIFAVTPGGRIEIGETGVIGVIESFVHHRTITAAHTAYAASAAADLEVAEARTTSGQLEFQSGRVILRYPPISASVSADLTLASKTTLAVGRTLARGTGAPAPAVELSREEFSEAADYLYRIGLINVPVGAIDFGDLGRLAPIDDRFGIGRGTPVDRIYLHRFMATLRDRVQGDILEVGGHAANRQLFGFSKATSWRTLDIAPAAHTDVVGDVHDPNVIGSESVDAVVILNVLEHCERPWIVAENIARWLRPGGLAVVAVPTAQRVHRMPKDCWRILPDGLETLFARFSERQIVTWGNAMTCCASLMGVAAEEISSDDLDVQDDRYPVMVSMVAVR